jgi:5-methylcytosine-specific restriction endonuclease McrA
MARAKNPKNRYGARKRNDEIFVEDSKYARHNLKRRIIEENLIPYFCSECGIVDSWNNKKLVIQLDHINGVNNDNRLENLRFLCPNCHTQTDTFSCKRLKK